MKKNKNSRIMIAAPKSGSGKTLITCALLGALKERGLNVMAFKCGPDYIDPMFHRVVQNIPAENLDTFFSGEKTVQVLAEGMKEHEIGVVEGVMGLYDGVGGIWQEGSSYHLAKVTNTPIILVADVRGMGRSMIPMFKGFLDYDKEKLIKGIILNRISPGFFEKMKPILEEELDVEVIGYYPMLKELSFESRHLGLKLPGEIEEIQQKLKLASEKLPESISIDRIISIANEAANLIEEPLDLRENEIHMKESSVSCENEKMNAEISTGKKGEHNKQKLKLAVARDEAFCFYYETNLREFEKRGVEIVDFSPLHDERIPEGVSGLLLGGGYPELYARYLSENVTMRQSVKKTVQSGIPSLAECGGFMYLHTKLTDAEGNTYEMADVVDGKVMYTPKLVRFGYIEIQEEAGAFLPSGTIIKGHEFHYFDSSNNGDSCIATKPVLKENKKSLSENKDCGQGYRCIHATENGFWGFPHLYYPSAPEFVDRFVEKMRKYAAGNPIK